MTNCIFYTLFFAMFVSVSLGSLRFSQIHRSFMSIYKGMLEASIITVDSNGEPVVPYYSVDLVNNNVRTYLENRISKYTNNYTISIDYFDYENGNVNLTECRYLTIKLKANINFFYKYDNAQSYSIMSRDQL